MRSIRATVAGAFLFASLSVPALADNLDRKLEVINQTGFTIVAFYGSHTDAGTWEENIFGGEVLASGQSVVVNFDDGTGYCVFDIRAEFDDGDVLEEYGVNVCELETFTYE